jgi:hypothetical protein
MINKLKIENDYLKGIARLSEKLVGEIYKSKKLIGWCGRRQKLIHSRANLLRLRIEKAKRAR